MTAVADRPSTRTVPEPSPASGTAWTVSLVWPVMSRPDGSRGAPVSSDRELTLAGGVGTALSALVVSALASLVATVDAAGRLWTSDGEGSTVVSVGYLVVVAVLGSVMILHLQARLGAARALAHHRPAQGSEIRALADEPARVTVLISVRPGEEGALRRALLAAALQEQPGLRVVVAASDDQTRAAAEPWRDALERVVADVAGSLDECSEKAAHAAMTFHERAAAASVVGDYEIRLLIHHLRESACVLGNWAGRLAFGDYADRFLADRVLDRLAADFRDLASDFERLADAGSAVPAERVRAAYRRLSDTFGARIDVVGVAEHLGADRTGLGASVLECLEVTGPAAGVRETATHPGDDRAHGRPAAPDASRPPDADFAVLLDVNTVLLPEYVLRLSHLLRRPESADVAGVLAPLAPIPDASTRSRRVAGAVAGLESQLRLGAARGQAEHHGVQAPAVFRRPALRDLAAERTEGRSSGGGAPSRPGAASAPTDADRTAPKNGALAMCPERLAYGDIGLTGAVLRRPGLDVVAAAPFVLGAVLILVAALLGWVAPAGSIHLALVVAIVAPSVALVAADLPKFPYFPLDAISATTLGVLLLPTTFLRIARSAMVAALSPARDRLRAHASALATSASTDPGGVGAGGETAADHPGRVRSLRSGCPRHAASRGRREPAPPAFARRTPAPGAVDAVDAVWWFPVQHRLALRSPQLSVRPEG